MMILKNDDIHDDCWLVLPMCGTDSGLTEITFQQKGKKYTETSTRSGSVAGTTKLTKPYHVLLIVSRSLATIKCSSILFYQLVTELRQDC